MLIKNVLLTKIYNVFEFRGHNFLSAESASSKTFRGFRILRIPVVTLFPDFNILSSSHFDFLF